MIQWIQATDNRGPSVNNLPAGKFSEEPVCKAFRHQTLSGFRLNINKPVNVSKPLSRSNSNPNLYPLNSTWEYLLRKKQANGEIIAINGVNQSVTFLFVNNPKENSPNKGP